MSETHPQKRRASPRPPSLNNDIRISEYPERRGQEAFVRLVENDHRHKHAWLEIDAEQVVKVEDMA